MMKMKECFVQVIELLKSIDSKMGHQTPTVTKIDDTSSSIENHDLKQQLNSAQNELGSLKTELQQAHQNAKHTAWQDLKPWTDFQAALLQDADLTQLLLAQYSDEAELPQLIRLIASAAQWEQVERVWDELKKRCDREQRAANATELQLLAHCLAAHNLAFHNRQAKISDVAIGSAFNSREHIRANPRGETVSEQWLPALHNAGGIRTRQALVWTE